MFVRPSIFVTQLVAPFALAMSLMLAGFVLFLSIFSYPRYNVPAPACMIKIIARVTDIYYEVSDSFIDYFIKYINKAMYVSPKMRGRRRGQRNARSYAFMIFCASKAAAAIPPNHKGVNLFQPRINVQDLPFVSKLEIDHGRFLASTPGEPKYQESEELSVYSPWQPAGCLIPGLPDLPKIRANILCMPAKNVSKKGQRPAPRQMTFDTDSAPVGIDNRCSACMSHIRSDFVGELMKTSRAIKGYAGTQVFEVFIGTIRWNIMDDEGMSHEILIPHSFYVPSSSSRLISPQHWAQQAYEAEDDPDTKDPDGTRCGTFHDRAILIWGDGRYQKTVQVDGQNVFTFNLAAGYNEFTAFCTQIGYDAYEQDVLPDAVDRDELMAYENATNTANADDDDPVVVDPGMTVSVTEDRNELIPEGGAPIPNLDGEGEDDEDVTVEFDMDSIRLDPTAELLRMHYKYGHISFRRLQQMA